MFFYILDVDCGKLPPLPYGTAELLNGTTHLGSVIQYSCTTNFRLVGPVRRTCTEDHQWSDSSPRCEGKPKSIYDKINVYNNRNHKILYVSQLSRGIKNVFKHRMGNKNKL